MLQLSSRTTSYHPLLLLKVQYRGSYRDLNNAPLHQITVSPSVLSLSSRQMRSVGRKMLKSSSVSGEIYTQERTDGSQSDTALGTVGGGSKKRRSSLSARVVAIVGNRRSRSTSQISGPGELPRQP